RPALHSFPTRRSSDLALEVGEALIEHRHAALSFMMRDPRQLVLIAPAEESQPPHHVELPGVQQVQPKAARLEDHIVAVVELVDVDRKSTRLNSSHEWT